MMNDEEIQDATVLAIEEPQARRIQGRLLSTPDGIPQMDQDGSLNMKRRQMGDPKHALDQQGRGSRTGADRFPGHYSSDYPVPSRLVLVVSVYMPGVDLSSIKGHV